MLQAWFNENESMIRYLNESKDVKDAEYIDNLLELESRRNLETDTDIFYVLSRLILTRQNVEDDNIDAIVDLEILIVSLAGLIAYLYDNDDVEVIRHGDC